MGYLVNTPTEGPRKAWILCADYEFDQVCETEEDSDDEAVDLMDMGCTVQVIVVDWDQQDEVIDALQDGEYWIYME